MNHFKTGAIVKVKTGGSTLLSKAIILNVKTNPDDVWQFECPLTKDKYLIEEKCTLILQGERHDWRHIGSNRYNQGLLNTPEKRQFSCRKCQQTKEVIYIDDLPTYDCNPKETE